jgi:hypothetical protein
MPRPTSHSGRSCGPSSGPGSGDTRLSVSYTSPSIRNGAFNECDSFLAGSGASLMRSHLPLSRLTSVVGSQIPGYLYAHRVLHGTTLALLACRMSLNRHSLTSQNHLFRAPATSDPITRLILHSATIAERVNRQGT